MRILLTAAYCFLILVQGTSQSEFTNVTEAAGITPFTGSEGVSVGDFNQDGYDDFFVTVPFGKNRLYKNMGDGTFTEIAESAGVALSEDIKSRSSVWGDVNNDGWPDLFVGNRNTQDYLFLNLGNEQFEEISLSAGIFQTGNPISVNMADLNNDGFLDIYISNSMAHNGVYLNNQDNTFAFHSFSSQAMDTGLAMGTVLFDYDKDGDIDIYLVHDGFEPNFLYQNDGTAVFSEVAASTGVNTASFGMGVDIGDVNNDGWMDIYITNLGDNLLLLSDGNGQYSDISESANVEDFGMGWGTSFLDYDNDGLMDIYVANEYAFSPYPNVLYRNSGNLTFDKAEENSPVCNLDNSYGTATLDYNLDGNVDLLVANKNAGAGIQLFENADRPNNWLGINLIGTTSNRDAIGAKITLVDNLDRIHYRELVAGQGWASQHSHVVNIGLGSASEITEMSVAWPSGWVQTITVPELNAYYTVMEGVGIQAGIVYPAPVTAEVSLTPPACHGDNNGAILVEPAGGTPGYTYTWDNTEVTGNNPTNLAAGTYCVTITDLNGIHYLTCIDLPEPTTLGATSVIDAQVSCYGSADGIASVIASGGTPPYYYAWSNSANSATASDLPAGTYSITVTDANGCEFPNGFAVITQPEALMISVSSSAETNANEDGTATASLSGGTAPYAYAWNTDPVQTTATANGLSQGNYIVTATDANGCEITASVEVSQLQVITLATPENICLETGIQSGWTGGMPTGGIYSGSGVNDDGNGMTYSFDPVMAGPGEHTITYTFQNDSASGTIEVFDTPLVSLSFPDTIFYNDGAPPINLGGGSPAGGVYTDLYGEITDDGNGMTFSWDTLTAGFNNLTYSYTDQNGCTGSASQDFVVMVLSASDNPNPLALPLKMAPNPANNTIELSGIPIDRIDFFDAAGKSVRSLDRPSSIIDISALPKGIYILKVRSGDGYLTLRLIKE